MRWLSLAVVVSACTPLPAASVPVVTRPTEPLTGIDLTVVGYNVESGGAQSATIAEYVAQVQGEALWGFSETASQGWLDLFTTAAADDDAQDFRNVLGTTGGSDRLGIVWDDALLELLSTEEIDEVDLTGTLRAPLVGHFRVRGSGAEFKFMVNHLWRGDDGGRHQQAELLNAWGREETLPVVAVGDYNFDWSVDDGEADHDAGYDLMTDGDVWRWVRPDVLMPTQCSFAYDHVLDFTFVANAAKGWTATSEILFPQNLYCQASDAVPDHRPVSATLFVPDP